MQKIFKKIIKSKSDKAAEFVNGNVHFTEQSEKQNIYCTDKAFEFSIWRLQNSKKQA